jgi:FRG domain
MIESIEQFIAAIRDDASSWKPYEPKWFRGEPKCKTPLVPVLYRHEGLYRHENELLQMFRARAQGYHDVVPDRENTDQWLFLARHAGLPTRLLDWSEGALLGLHFALKNKEPIVWMLNPLDLNELSGKKQRRRPADEIREFPLAWHDPGRKANPAFENLAGAWQHRQRGVPLPVAVHPGYVHPRLRGQRACFTIHGSRRDGIDAFVNGDIVKRYEIDPARRQSMIGELRLLGVTPSVVFPDLDGLTADLIGNSRIAALMLDG